MFPLMCVEKEQKLRLIVEHFQQGRLNEAVDEYQKFIADNPADALTINALGDSSSHSREAVNHLIQIADGYRDGGIALKAIVMYNKIHQLDPANVDVCLRLAELYAQHDLNVEARYWYYKVACACYLEGRPQEARDIQEKIANIDASQQSHLWSEELSHQQNGSNGCAGLDRFNQELAAIIEARTRELLAARNAARESEQRAWQECRAKSALLANISHELRSPLNAIFGFAQLMARGKDRSAEDEEHLSIIMRSSEHLLGLINDTLSLSRIEANQFALNNKPFDARQLLKDLDEMFRKRAASKGLQLIFELAANLPKLVYGDECKLKQVFINLLNNAVKFTERGGIAVRMSWRDAIAHIEIEDTGLGIAENEIDKLFEPFMQTKSGQRANEGTGLGLVISRNIVRLMGGDISVKSSFEKGTIFSFAINLPIAAQAEPAQAQPRVVGLAEHQPKFCCLVVDDKAENRALLSKILSAVGFQTIEASNGQEAVEMWAQWQPDLIWMDLGMPVMDGYRATRLIRDYEAAHINGQRLNSLPNDLKNFPIKNPHTGIIAITASAFEHEREKIINSGCDDFVTKPFREETIFEKLAQHLKVRFIFEGAKTPACDALADINPARLTALPIDLLSNLGQAVTIGDVSDAHLTINKIGELDDRLAHELRTLLNNYCFTELLTLTEKSLAINNMKKLGQSSY